MSGNDWLNGKPTVYQSGPKASMWPKCGAQCPTIGATCHLDLGHKDRLCEATIGSVTARWVKEAFEDTRPVKVILGSGPLPADAGDETCPGQ